MMMPAFRLLFRVDAPDDNAIVQRAKLHILSSIRVRRGAFPRAEKIWNPGTILQEGFSEKLALILDAANSLRWHGFCGTKVAAGRSQ